MNSSDSEDDCYGNVAQKLQLLKNNFQKDKFVHDVLNESTDNATTEKIAGNCSKDSIVLIDHDGTPVGDDEEITLDSIIAQNRKKRLTRSTSKQHQIEPAFERPTRRNTKQKSSVNNVTAKSKDSTKKSTATSSNRGRGGRRKKSERTRSRRRAQSDEEDNQNIPTYSVGNTDYYPDFSHEQQLFITEKPNEAIVVVDDAVQSINEELSVKVIWQSSEFMAFNIRKYQKLTEIYDFYAKKENVSYEKLIFMYNDKIIKSDDTPETIDYNIVKFIEGGITSENISKFKAKKSVNTKSGLKLKFRCENVKQPFEVIVRADESLSLAMIQCAEHFETPLNKLKFIFDGDKLAGK